MKKIIIIFYFVLFHLSQVNAGTFSDVDEGHWAEKYIEYAVSTGIVSNDNDEFGFGDSIKIQDFLAMAYRAMNVTIPQGNSTEKYIDDAKTKNFISDDWEKDNTVTRAEGTKIITKIADIRFEESLISKYVFELDNIKLPIVTTKEFSDTSTHWCRPYVFWMYNAVLPSDDNNPIEETYGKSIIDGLPDSSQFVIDNELLREEAVKIIVNTKTYTSYIKRDRVIVQGYVNDGHGNTVDQARVILYGPNSFSQWTETTDGLFQFIGMMSAGEYYISVAKGGYQSYNGYNNRFHLEPGNFKNDILINIQEENNELISNITDVTVSESYNSATVYWKKQDKYPYTEIVLNNDIVCNTSGTSCTIKNLDMGTPYSLLAYSHDGNGAYAYTHTTINLFTHLGGELTKNRILSNHTYIVDVSLTIPKDIQLVTQNAALNFKSGQHLLVYGHLDSQTTAFSSVNPEKAAGQWGRIVFYPESSGMMKQCKVECASGSQYGSIEINNASLIFDTGRVENVSAYAFYIHDSADVTIQHSNIGPATYAGIYIDGKSSPKITDNTIHHCSYPIWLTYQSNSPIIKDNHFSDSFTHPDAVLTQGTITLPAIWYDDTDVWDTAITVTKDASLKIMPGTHVSFYDGSSHLLIYGQLIANGTSNNPIVFTSDDIEKAAGQWGRFVFYTNSSGVMNHCIVEYAGGSSYGSIEVIDASLHFENSQIRNVNATGIKIRQGSIVTVKDSLLLDVQNEGINIDGTSNPTIVNTVFNHCRYPIWLQYENNFPLIKDNQFLNSHTHPDAILLQGTITRSGNWFDPVDVWDAGLTVAQGVSLNIIPGNVVSFYNTNAHLAVKGELIAKGNINKPIVFTSDDVTGKKAGQWGKISFSPGSNGIFSNCIVEYAYGPSIDVNTASLSFKNGTIKDTSTTGINIKNASNVIVESSLFENAIGRGIEIDGTSSPQILSNSFIGCGYPMYLTYDSNFPFIKNNLFANSINHPNAVLVSGTISSSGTWFDPVHVYSAITVSGGANLNVAPGNYISFRTTNESLSVYGSLKATGTEIKPIIFSSEEEEKTAGQWGRIYFQPGSSGQMKHCILEYCYSNSINMDNAHLVFENNEIRHTAKSYGMNVVNNSVLSLNNNVFANIDSHAINANASTVWMTNNFLYRSHGVQISNTFTGSVQSNYFDGSVTQSSHWGVYNSSGIIVDANKSWWGDASGPYAAGCNDSGKGDKINNCDTVNFSNWLSEKPENYLPGAITDLLVTRTSNEKANIKWQSMGDDGAVGIVDHFDLRYCHEMVSEKNWDQCISAKGLPYPQESGTVQNYTMRGLSPDKAYFFAIRAYDSSGLCSGISNVSILPAINMKKVIQLLPEKIIGTKGQPFQIKWFDNTTDIAYLNLFYKTDQKEEWLPVAQFIGNNEEKMWDKWEPDFVDDSVWIRIEAFDQSDNLIGWDESNEFQEINQNGLIEMVSPQGTESLIAGKSFPIQWITTGYTDCTISIDLIDQNGSVIPIVSQTQNSGTFLWTPQQAIHNARIKIFLHDSDNKLIAYDISEAYIEVRSDANKLELLSPNGLEIYRPGDTINAVWSFEDASMDESMRLYLQSQSGRRIDYPQTSNDMSEHCRIPDDIASENQWKLCVDNQQTGLSDCSDNFFTILAANTMIDSSDDCPTTCDNIPGDADLNGQIDLKDIIINLQTVTGMELK
jgi:parallel beta-helix repeat protein